MILGGLLRKVTIVAFIAVSLILLAIPTANALPDLTVRVSDTTGPVGAFNSVISVYFSNSHDTVSGFRMHLQLDRPDIMTFKTDTATLVDTSYWECLAYDGDDCIDSVLSTPLSDWDFIHVDTGIFQVGSLDSTGTLVSGWECIWTRSPHTGNGLLIEGWADLPGDMSHGPAILPSQGNVLIKLLADIHHIPDTATERTVNIMILSELLGSLFFYRPDGSLIGMAYETVEDTNYYNCIE